MADQKHIKSLAERDEASMALGRAWGLAETLCYHTGERPGEFDPEGVMRVVFSFVHQAREKMQEGSVEWQEIGAALAVCDLVLVDSQEANTAPNSAFTWALEAVPEAIRRAKEVIDSRPWELQKAA